MTYMFTQNSNICTFQSENNKKDEKKAKDTSQHSLASQNKNHIQNNKKENSGS